MPRTEPEGLRPNGETLQFMQQLWKLVHALDVRSKRMAKELGITGPQRLVVRVVGQSSMISARDLAATLDIHPSTLTGVLARLETGGLIARVIDPEDRRRALFRLTAAGRAVDRERKGTVEAAVRRALGRADRAAIANTTVMLALLVAELLPER
jgi:MarR family transcriptional regulator, organic hydroperoxide resistance regulator